jgi:hypothetical protein
MSQDKLRDRLVEAARRRRAREATEPPDPEALAPLDSAAKDRMAARALEALQPPAAQAQVIPFRRRARVVSVAGAALAALAAALVLFLRPAGPSPLPAYEATFSGESALRGTEPPSGPPRVGPGSALTLLARPRQPVQGPVEVSAFLVRGDSARPWAAPAQVSAEGAVRISGAADALLPPEPGPWTAVIVIRRPGAPSSGPEDALRYARGEAPAAAGVQVIQVRFEQTGP